STKSAGGKAASDRLARPVPTGSEMPFQPCAQIGLGNRSNKPADLLAALDQDKQGYSLDPVSLGNVRSFIDVELHDFEATGVGASHALDQR
ncbi:MAG: hypothetical protein QOD66_1320, partial [Solirubrobacteraceae bacterium]|nr:hypothetical protein [Solirubrobacteraceae bacterium]